MPDLWELTKKAKAGDVEAQLAVAHAFETGEGVEKNTQEAFNWYKQAAANGDADGYYHSGLCMMKLDPQNQTAAAKWFFEAARVGHLSAQIKLGFGYCSSLPFVGRESGCEYWLKMAAEQGDITSQIELGKFYLDIEEKSAFSWFEKAALQDDSNTDAKFLLAECYRKGIGTEASPKQAFLLYREAADDGCEKGMREVGKCYLEGFGVGEFEDEAILWFKKGAELDDAESYYHLGRCYHSAWGTPHDDEAEFSAFENAVHYADLNDTPLPEAKLMLGICYYDGAGVDVDYKAAIHWFEQAAKEGVASAYYMLGECYFHGQGVRKNRKKAFEYYLKTVECEDHDDAEYSLGVCYESGYGTEADLLKAIYWYTKAETDGSDNAKDELDRLLKRK